MFSIKLLSIEIVYFCVEYLDQVRTKRRSLDRREASSSPTRDGEGIQGTKSLISN